MKTYAEMLAAQIKVKGLTLEAVASEVELRHGFRPNLYYLGRLRNGVVSPASDKMNAALADVLDLDIVELQAAAYSEKLADSLEKLNKE